MIEKSKRSITTTNKKKKGLITEEDMSSLLQRYAANTVLALLQEVAQFEGMEIDWHALVKKTTTGIDNVREYQMLWRHLAYRHALLDNFEDGAEPLDDDSDLEYELEPFPDVSSEASAEAAACVKVLIASGAPSDSAHPNGNAVEAFLTINIPNGQSVKATSEISQPSTMGGMNITVPVSVQKQPLPTVASIEGLDANGLGNGIFPPRRKRKPWSEAEDLELIAAVQKYGEGNWANILRSEFNWERTASQLSQLQTLLASFVFACVLLIVIVFRNQRWKNIQKRHGNGNPVSNTGGVQLSEARQAARHAMNLALDLQVKNTFVNGSVEGTSAQHQSGRPFLVKSSPMVSLGSASESQIIVKKPAKPDLHLDPVRAAAMAAGARIATQSDAASLLKDAQAKNAVHIMPTGSSSLKSAVPGGTSTFPVNSPDRTHPAVSSAGPHAPSNSDPAKNISTIQTNAEFLLKTLPNAELSSQKDAETAGGI